MGIYVKLSILALNSDYLIYFFIRHVLDIFLLLLIFFMILFFFYLFIFISLAQINIFHISISLYHFFIIFIYFLPFSLIFILFHSIFPLPFPVKCFNLNFFYGIFSIVKCINTKKRRNIQQK